MGCAEASRYYGMRLQQEKVQSAFPEAAEFYVRAWFSLYAAVCL